jgi:Exostosin family
MRVFFEPVFSTWATESGYTKKWESLISNLKQDNVAHSITDNRSTADVIIHPGTEHLGHFKAILKPLSNNDINFFVWDWADRPSGRCSGFYCSLDKRLYDQKRHRTVHYPIPFNEFVEDFSQVDARYNFGFLGGNTTGLRGRIYDKLKPHEKKDNSFIKIQGIDFWKTFNDGSQRSIKLDYVSFLKNTKFILCPRGYGVGSVRLFESMKAGRVPVIISDRYVLPEGVDWSGCSVRIRERDIDKIPKILESKLDNWPLLARNARASWEAIFSNDHFFKYLTNNLEEMISHLPRITLGYQFKYAAALGVQLADHHYRPLLGHVRRLVKRNM